MARFLFRLSFTLLLTAMTMLISLFVYAVIFHGFNPIILLISLVPFCVLLILTFWLKEI